MGHQLNGIILQIRLVDKERGQTARWVLKVKGLCGLQGRIGHVTKKKTCYLIRIFKETGCKCGISRLAHELPR